MLRVEGGAALLQCNKKWVVAIKRQIKGVLRQELYAAYNSNSKVFLGKTTTADTSEMLKYIK